MKINNLHIVSIPQTAVSATTLAEVRFFGAERRRYKQVTGKRRDKTQLIPGLHPAKTVTAENEQTNNNYHSIRLHNTKLLLIGKIGCWRALGATGIDRSSLVLYLMLSWPGQTLSMLIFPRQHQK